MYGAILFYHPQLTTLSKEGDLNDDSAYPTSKGGDKKLASKDESDDEEEVSNTYLHCLAL